jgi:hypothetical protein
MRYPAGKSGAEYTIPDYVTSISGGAFEGCSSLTEIDIPNSVTSIWWNTFMGHSSLTEINVSENNTEYSSDNGVLFNKDKSELIRYPASKSVAEYTIPDYVTSISGGAFEGCSSLSEINIPSNVMSVGNYAFRGCKNLSEVVISEGVKFIGSSAFASCTNLNKITIPESVSLIYHAFVNCDNLTIYGYEDSYAQTYAIENNITFKLVGEPDFETGDVDENGVVDNVDSTFVLIEYTLTSTGQEGTFTDEQKKAADVNGDDRVDNVDSTFILSYYTYIATGGEGTFSDYMNN